MCCVLQSASNASQQADSMSSSGGVSSGNSTHRPPHPHFRVLQQALTGGDHVIGKGGINLESRGRGMWVQWVRPCRAGAIDAAAASFAAGQPPGDQPATPCPCSGTHPVLQDDTGQAQAAQSLLPLGRGHQASSAVARRRQHLRLLLVALCGQAKWAGQGGCSFAGWLFICMHAVSNREIPTACPRPAADGPCAGRPGSTSGGTVATAAAAAAAGAFFFARTTVCQLHRRPTCTLHQLLNAGQGPLPLQVRLVAHQFH